MLKVSDINVYYGAIHALKGISFHVEEGEIVSLIGANGAGKTTTMQTISGLLRSRTGSITFRDTEISKTEPHKIVRMGLGPGARRAPGFLHHDGAGKSGDGRLHSVRKKGGHHRSGSGDGV